MDRLRREGLEPGGDSMTQEEISREVLGKRSGYLKGFGVGPKPSSYSRATATSRAHQEEVKNLQEEIQSLRGQLAANEIKFAELAAMVQLLTQQSQGGEHSGNTSSWYVLSIICET